MTTCRAAACRGAVARLRANAYPAPEIDTVDGARIGAVAQYRRGMKGRTMTRFTGRSGTSRRTIIKGAGALAAGVAAPAVLRVRSAWAAYPERPVKIVVANTPGGPSDIVARIVAAALQEQTGKTFI